MIDQLIHKNGIHQPFSDSLLGLFLGEGSVRAQIQRKGSKEAKLIEQEDEDQGLLTESTRHKAWIRPSNVWNWAAFLAFCQLGTSGPIRCLSLALF